MRTFVPVGTGLIYAAIVAAWAAYLVPLWLRRQDDAIAAREEGMTIGGRVVRRATVPAESVDAVESGDADRPADGEASVDDEPVDEEEFVPVGPTSAARRRRTLLVLLLAATATAIVAAIGYAPWWAVAIPGGMVVAFIAISAVAAGHERRHRRSARAALVAADDAVDAKPATAAAADTADDARAESAPRRPRDDGLWDPVSVPLPTYVTKAKAPRTVRTISLSDPDTWTSGRLREPEPAERAEIDADAATGTDDAKPRTR